MLNNLVEMIKANQKSIVKGALVLGGVVVTVVAVIALGARAKGEAVELELLESIIEENA